MTKINPKQKEGKKALKNLIEITGSKKEPEYKVRERKIIKEIFG